MTTPSDYLAPLASTNYKNFRLHIQMAIETDTPLFAWGASGIGKTAIIESVTKDLGVDFKDLFVLAYESIDIGGLPQVDAENRMCHAASRLIPLDTDECPNLMVVYLDEVPLAVSSMQSVLYKVLNERLAGGRKIHPNIRFILSGNRVKDGGHITPIPPAIKNRGKGIELMIDVEGSTEHAHNCGLHPTIIGYWKDNPTSIHALQKGEQHYKTLVKGMNFNSQRSWHALSKELYKIEANEEMKGNLGFIQEVVAGHIGEHETPTFMLAYEKGISLPNPDKIFKGEAEDQALDTSEEYHVVLNLSGTLRMKYGNSSDQNYAYNDKVYKESINNSVLYMERNMSAESIALFFHTIRYVHKLVIPHEGCDPFYRHMVEDGSDSAKFMRSTQV